MILEIINHEYQYEAEKLTRVFFPNEKISVVFKKANAENEAVLTTEFDSEFVNVSFTDKNGQTLFSKQKSVVRVDDRELIMAQLMFEALQGVTGYTPKWGMLTGIRPSKFLRSLKSKHGEKEGKEIFQNSYLVSSQKTELADSVANAEQKIIALSKPESFSIYVSIPFCPTRCSYCSFVSHDMTSQTVKKLMPDYLDCLEKEIRYTAEIADKLNLRLESIYWGGGTPATLTADGLKRIMGAIAESFNLSTVREYTIEAGRPDTVSADKLKVMKDGGVSRISINPQSFSDNVLKAIGRCHTAEQTVNAFNLAREYGFDNINTDLIAGLPEDSIDGFKASLDRTLALSAESITVHTLALKRSSYMGEEGKVQVQRALEAADMLDYAYDTLTGRDYFPYYMYRQSKTLGNLENTGYCKEGKECLYNIFMMEECHSVLALGAGAVTRLKAPKGDKISRIFNYKYPYEYIKDFDELIKRKADIISFYEENI